MFKKLTSLILSAALLTTGGALTPQSADGIMSMFSFSADAAETVVFDGDTMSDFATRTPEIVAKKYTDAFYAGKSYVDGDESTYYTVAASVKNPYNEGVLTDDTLLCMQEMTSFYRWLVGSQPLSAACEQTPSLQYQALDRNFEFNHTISQSSKPADMSQTLWDKGFALDHNILAWGYTPLGAVTGWMNEGYNLSTKSWGALGHRIALIHPDHIDQQFGYCGVIGIGKYDYTTSVSSRNPFYAFPSPSYNPSSSIYPTESAWSVGIDRSQVTYSKQSDITVTVTNLTTNASYSCTTANGKLNFEGDSFFGFVQPSDYNATTKRYDSNYKVVVKGLKDKATSKAAQIQYTVKFFELKDYAASAITKAGLNFNKILIYNDTFDSTDALKKLGACLPHYVTITNEFGSTAKVRTTGAWQLDENESCFYNSVNPSDVPVKFADTTGILNKIKIQYEYTDDMYCQYNYLTPSASKVTEGTQVTFEIYRPYYSMESSALCQIVKDENGGYVCKKTYSSLSSPEFDKVNSTNTNHYFKIDAEPEDSGQYISIYYSTQEYWQNAYVCTNARSLTVSHNYTLQSSKEATCTDRSEQVYKCSICGDTYTEYGDAPLGHAYTGKVVGATCTERGYTHYTCSRCGDEMIGSYTPAKGHSWGSWSITTPATCTSDGVQTHSCSVCGTAETQTITAQGHKYSQTGTVIPPTCTEQGYTQFTCSACGYVLKVDYTTPSGHSWSAWTATEQATCSKEGTETRTCSVCEKTETRPIAKLEHQLVFVKTVAPTCEEEGYDLYACANCDQYEHRNKVSATGHDFGEWTTTVQPTCKKEGLQIHTCSKCSKTESQPIEKLSHSFKYTKTVDPTCTEQGYDLYTCENCGDTKTENIKPANGHSFGEWTTTTQPTCSAEGVSKHTCSACGASETKPIDKLEHSLVQTVVDPTCTEQGYTRWTCRNCSYSKTDSYKTELGHAMSEWTTTVQPTCTTEGTAKKTCSRCGFSETRTVEKTAHDFALRTVAATCTAQGYTEHTCTVCKYSYKDNITPLASHKYGDWVTVLPTVISPGGRFRTCSVCGNTENEPGEKLSLRIAGTDRFDTSFKTADRLKEENGGEAFKNIIVASGMDFADALSATYLSSVKGAPILLNINNAKRMDTLVAYIKANAAPNATVYIVGGTGAVDSALETKLSGFKVKRLAGKNRYLTNIEVLKETGVSADELLVASGISFADALSASAVGKPIFLVAGSANSLTADQQKYLSQTSFSTATIIGGKGAVSEGIASAIKTGYKFKSVTRLGGSSRYETSVLVAQKYFDNPPTICLAYGNNYPDGLCGGALAYKYHSPLILTVNMRTANAQAYAKQIGATNSVSFGGEALISEDMIKQILGK